MPGAPEQWYSAVAPKCGWWFAQCAVDVAYSAGQAGFAFAVCASLVVKLIGQLLSLPGELSNNGAVCTNDMIDPRFERRWNPEVPHGRADDNDVSL